MATTGRGMAPLTGPMLLLLVASCCLGVAHAQGKVRVFGDRYYHPTAPEEWLRTYVDMPKDHDGDTLPLSVGVQITPGFIRRANDLPISINYTIVARDQIPGQGKLAPNFKGFPYVISATEQIIKFPQVGRNPFKFLGYNYNHYGHIPIGLYDFEHFDVRFFFETGEWWWGEQYPPSSFVDPSNYSSDSCGGSTAEVFYNTMLPIPLDCWPGDPNMVYNLGHHVWGSGGHIYNFAEPGWQAYMWGNGTDHTDSLTWGMQAGRIAYIESMFSRDLALKPDLDNCVDFEQCVPKHFDTERASPTTKCLLAGEKTFKLEYSNFKMVPGGCEDMRNGTMEGYAPEDVVSALYGPLCKVPKQPGTPALYFGNR